MMRKKEHRSLSDRRSLRVISDPAVCSAGLVCLLFIWRERLRELAAAAGRTRAERETAALLRQVDLDCNAALIEELIACKSSHGGAMLLAKNDFGYTDKGDGAAAEPVCFVGEERLEE